MENFKKILVPIDGSAQAEQALKQAIYIAEFCQAEIGLLYVVDLNQQISAFEQVSTGGYVPSEIKEKGCQILADAMHDVPREINAKSIVEVGAPSKVIVDVCEQREYNLIIMGSRGLGAIKRIVMGSVSQYVLLHASCPVLIVR
jgi:nucleotide-binding universal stress UspA family protein